MSASPRPLVAVVFDLDGVIVDTAKLHYAAWKRLADSLSLHFDERLNEALKGIDRLRSLDLLLGLEASSVTAAEKQRLAELKNSWYVQSLHSIGAADLLPGAHAALDQVRTAGVRIGLASASRNAPAVLDCLGIADQFDAIVDPSVIPRGKPAPDMFLAAARALEAKPEGCLGIEDAAAGVVGLKAAGMAVIGVGDPMVLQEADWVIPDLTHFHLSDYRSIA